MSVGKYLPEAKEASLDFVEELRKYSTSRFH